MSVHVGEIHTELSGARSGSGQAGGTAPSGPRYPGAQQDEWRETEAQVRRLQRRVCAEDFDD